MAFPLLFQHERNDGDGGVLDLGGRGYEVSKRGWVEGDLDREMYLSRRSHAGAVGDHSKN